MTELRKLGKKKYRLLMYVCAICIAESKAYKKFLAWTLVQSYREKGEEEKFSTSCTSHMVNSFLVLFLPI